MAVGGFLPAATTYDDRVSITAPRTLVDQLDAMGPAGLRRAARDASAMFAADVSAPVPAQVDPVPAVLTAARWDDLTAGLIQRARLLDAVFADLYGPRTLLDSDVAPTAELLRDPAYLRPAIGLPAPGGHQLFMLGVRAVQDMDGAWRVIADDVEVPQGAGCALEIRRVLSRSAPALYRSTAVRRLNPFFDAVRTELHRRSVREDRAGRVVVITDDADPMLAFDHHRFATLLGAPTVACSDLQATGDAVVLRPPGGEIDTGDAVGTLLRLVPSAHLDPLDLGPSPIGGVVGLVEAARAGDITVVNPVGAGLLENPALREALPDLCRELLHEDLQLRSADLSDLDRIATSSCLDPNGGDEPVQRPLALRLLMVATADGFSVLPGGIATTLDAAPEAMKDVWVLQPERSGIADDPAIDDSTVGSAPGATLALENRCLRPGERTAPWGIEDV